MNLGETVNKLNTASNGTIEVGKVVYVKTSEEPVFVLAIDNQTAIVRRPISSKSGVSHVLDTFGLLELETRESKTEDDAAFTKFQLGVRDKLARERQKEASVQEARDSAATPEFLN